MSTNNPVAPRPVVRPTLATARIEAKRFERRGLPVPAFYAKVLDEAKLAARVRELAATRLSATLRRVAR